MNKKLVAVAVAGAFALPLAAQAQTANVTLYGRANLDLEFVRGAQAASVTNGIPAGDNPTVVRVASNTSRFGLRGQESLGGGLQRPKRDVLLATRTTVGLSPAGIPLVTLAACAPRTNSRSKFARPYSVTFAVCACAASGSANA